MKSITWSDGIGSRGRGSWLLLARADEVLVFKGQGIPGVLVVRGTDYQQNGKWSHTTFRIEAVDGVRVIAGRDGWETGRFVEGLHEAVQFPRPIDTWSDVAEALGVSVTSAMSFLRSWRPKAAGALDEVDRKIGDLEESAESKSAEAELVTVSFGSPTNRQIAEGFWTSPKGITGGGEIRLIDPSAGWKADNVEVVGRHGTVVKAVHALGYHGGYVTVTVAVTKA